MSIMTDADREQLKSIFDALDRAGDAIDAFLSPFRKIEGEIANARELLMERHEISGIAGKCESCGKILFEGDKGHRYGDDSGIIHCEECAPTRADVASSWEHTEESELQEWFDTAKPKAEIVADYLAAGPADEKILHEL